MLSKQPWWIDFSGGGLRKVLLLFFLATLSSLGQPMQAQDVPYSQSFASGIYLNPALSGVNIYPRFKLFHREQWTSIPRAYTNTHFFFDFYSERMDAGLGAYYKNDSQGDGILQSHSLRLAYSKPIQLNHDWYFYGGLYAAYYLRQLNWSKLQFGDQLDPYGNPIHVTGVPRPEHTTLHFPDFGGGLAFSYKEKLYFGATINHLFRPKLKYYENAYDRLSMKFSGHLAYVIMLKDDWPARHWEKNASLTPALLFEKHGFFYHVTAGFYFSREPFLAGVWMRHAFENLDAVIFNFGFQQPRYKVGYSFDLTVSPLTTSTSGGSHEISLTWYLERPEPRDRRHRHLPCPPAFQK